MDKVIQSGNGIWTDTVCLSDSDYEKLLGMGAGTSVVLSDGKRASFDGDYYHLVLSYGRTVSFTYSDLLNASSS